MCILKDSCTPFYMEQLTAESVEQNPPSEAHNLSAGQETTRILWNYKAPYCVKKSPPVLILS
jgi:hypothetical protein